jgi:PadR family transcriptional regulator, regulatory protein PadR
MDISKSDIYLLLALAEGPAHGYAMMQNMRERSAGAVRVSTGSFYRRLSALLTAGLVEETAGPKQDDPRRGAYYRLTATGRRALAEERDRLAALVAAVDGLRAAPRRGRP